MKRILLLNDIQNYHFSERKQRYTFRGIMKIKVINSNKKGPCEISTKIILK